VNVEDKVIKNWENAENIAQKAIFCGKDIGLSGEFGE
jgi:hypothetical protein